jgi:hypothetical protein
MGQRQHQDRGRGTGDVKRKADRDDDDKAVCRILDIAISNGVTGITSRWSIVPCSRSPTTAAPLPLQRLRLLQRRLEVAGVHHRDQIRADDGVLRGFDNGRQRAVSALAFVQGKLGGFALADVDDRGEHHRPLVRVDRVQSDFDREFSPVLLHSEEIAS